MNSYSLGFLSGTISGYFQLGIGWWLIFPAVHIRSLYASAGPRKSEKRSIGADGLAGALAFSILGIVLELTDSLALRFLTLF